MKTSVKIWIIAIMALLLMTGTGAAYVWLNNRSLLKQVRDLQVELAHAQIPLRVDTIRDSVTVVSQRIVEVDKTDYKKQLADKQLIKDLGLKVSQIESENHQLRELLGKVQMTAVKKDSDSLFVYHDKWADFEVNLRSKMMEYLVRDSFDIFVATIYKHKFLWWRWGKKGYDVKFVNYNPNTRIVHNQTIMVSR